MEIWICAIAKMEELYIREWIEWNKKIGIDHIIIGDNNDSDYDKPLQPIIQDYIDEGYIEIININNVPGCQYNFYNEIYLSNLDKFDWIGFIDIDEFIELPGYNNDVHIFLNNDKLNNIDAVILPWLNYGDNGYLYYKNKPVKERFVKYILSKKNISGIKYFIKSSDNISKIVSFHNPQKNKTNDNSLIKCCDSLFNENFTPIYKDDLKKSYTQIQIDNNYYNTAYISHYITKSTEEYIKYKLLRGRADRNINNFDTIRYTKKFYYNFNDLTHNKEKLFNKYSNQVFEKYNK